MEAYVVEFEKKQRLQFSCIQVNWSFEPSSNLFDKEFILHIFSPTWG